MFRTDCPQLAKVCRFTSLVYFLFFKESYVYHFISSFYAILILCGHYWIKILLKANFQFLMIGIKGKLDAPKAKVPQAR